MTDIFEASAPSTDPVPIDFDFSFSCFCESLSATTGECYDGAGLHIATCFNTLNETSALCRQVPFQAANDTSVIGCLINTTDSASSPLIAPGVLLIVGGVLGCCCLCTSCMSILFLGLGSLKMIVSDCIPLKCSMSKIVGKHVDRIRQLNEDDFMENITNLKNADQAAQIMDEWLHDIIGNFSLIQAVISNLGFQTLLLGCFIVGYRTTLYVITGVQILTLILSFVGTWTAVANMLILEELERIPEDQIGVVEGDEQIAEKVPLILSEKNENHHEVGGKEEDHVGAVEVKEEDQANAIEVDEEDQTGAIEDEVEDQAVTVESDEENQTGTVKGNEEDQGVVVEVKEEDQADAIEVDEEDQTGAVEDEVEDQAVTVESDGENQTGTVKGNEEDQGVVEEVKEEDQADAIEVDEEDQIGAVEDEVEDQAVTVESDGENQTGTVKGNKEDQAVEVTAMNSYNDITDFISKAMLLFLAQVILLSMYIAAIILEEKPTFADYHQYVYYFLGALMQVAYTFSREDPNKYHMVQLEYWKTVFREAKDRNVCCRKKSSDTDQSVPPNEYSKVPKFSLWVRAFMSTAMNGTGKALLFVLLPLHLSHSGEKESLSEDMFFFLASVVSAYYIINLADIKEKRIELLRKEHCDDESSSSSGCFW